MSEAIKENKAKAAKILGAAFFVLMMLFSLQITTNPDSAGDIDLLGLKVSLYTPSVFATEGVKCQDVFPGCESLGEDYCGAYVYNDCIHRCYRVHYT